MRSLIPFNRQCKVRDSPIERLARERSSRHIIARGVHAARHVHACQEPRRAVHRRIHGIRRDARRAKHHARQGGPALGRDEEPEQHRRERRGVAPARV